MPPSLLDRLIDEDPAPSREGRANPARRYALMKRAVARDLESLLNTKAFVAGTPDDFRHLNRSLYAYGLPDFTSKNPRSPAVRAELREEIENAVRLFEPRLGDVTVQVEETGSKGELRFRIDALLVMEREREPVTFDTLLDVTTGRYLVPK